MFKYILDIETVEILELVHSLNESLPNYHLFNALNHCSTPLGKKLLRKSLHEPSCSLNQISQIHNCIEELIDDQTLMMVLTVSDFILL